jgi:hypothetical protein
MSSGTPGRPLAIDVDCDAGYRGEEAHATGTAPSSPPTD